MSSLEEQMTTSFKADVHDREVITFAGCSVQNRDGQFMKIQYLTSYITELLQATGVWHKLLSTPSINVIPIFIREEIARSITKSFQLSNYISEPHFQTFTCRSNIKEVTSMQRLWNHAPQHPKKATTKATTPAVMHIASALATANCGANEAYPPWAKCSQIPTPSTPQPSNCQQDLALSEEAFIVVQMKMISYASAAERKPLCCMSRKSINDIICDKRTISDMKLTHSSTLMEQKVRLTQPSASIVLPSLVSGFPASDSPSHQQFPPHLNRDGIPH
ncbi:hypothetical protein J437_LFUL015730 [Ladona fulva]|uniref:Uncharacterized protein n=1 Tax=Ladona fulva TaxID=123851 RepID=A0A8K0P777_LADFU|nr:hypothetical protein J437_LFUL015730 [Ladona fulva]